VTGISARQPLLTTNLLNELETLADLLGDRLAAGDALDAFLLAAGMQQVVEDHLHPDPLLLDRAAARLRRRLPAPWGRLGGMAAHAAAAAAWQGLSRSPGTRATAAWLGDLDAVVQRLADAVVAGSAPHVPVGGGELLSRLPGLPTAARRAVISLPSCFRSFDQSLEDVEALAAAFAGRWPDRRRPLLVVGIRSSGSYLAPLTAACLRRRGHQDVQAATLRPARRWRAGEARRFALTARSGALALLVDDPPRTWGAVERAARDLGRLGFGPEQVVLVLGTFPAAGRPPAALAAHPAVLLPFATWSIGARLQPEAVRETLAGWLPVTAVRPLAWPSGDRGHAAAVYEVECGPELRLVRARGVGLGYLGRHALAVAGRLPCWATTVYGLDGGILYEAWSPATARLREPLSGSDVEAVARYVAARGRALPVDRDPCDMLRRRGEAGEWTGHALAAVFGRAAELGRPLGVAIARRLLRPAAPAVIDGHTGIGAFSSTAHGLVKHDFDTGVFGSDDFCCFDPVSDAAGAALDLTGPVAAALRSAYEAATGRAIDPERWLLHQLAHVLLSWERMTPEARHTDPRPARLVQRYLGEVLLSDVEPAASGPLCAIDLDGVLESSPLGFSATTPLGALSLRALARHGFRPLLATGRSLAEVRDRCDAYRLTGGVAEYGSALLIDGRARALLTSAERDALDRLRALLTAEDAVFLDPAYRLSVRAFRLDAAGRPRGLRGEQVARALSASAAADLLRVVPGHSQTDFVAASASKERALGTLASALGAGGAQPVALAVGDTTSDLGMLRLARMGVAPGNADAVLRRAAGVVVVGPRAQAGLAEAVSRVAGHAPGGCATCAPPRLTARTRLLLDLLAMPEPGTLRRASRTLRLAVAAVAGTRM
jgi:hydroxymethylpyrimidine pyrophosphatase-like HAD family hydrolase